MSHNISLTTHDGQQLYFTCASGQTVQEAAEAASFFLPAICKAGSCGSCLGRCLKGDYHLGSHSPSLLSAHAKDRGDVLLCRTYAESDLKISVPYKASAIQTSQQAPREAEIVSVDQIAGRTVRLVLQFLPDPVHGLAFEFEPGQFVELEIPDLDLKRAYSIANTPNWDGSLEFLIRLQPHGQFSTFLQQTAQPGQRMVIEGPSGTFGLQEQSLSPRCFIAGGTGLAPFLSILQRMAEWGEDHPTQLFLGVNSEDEIFCQEELTALTQAIPSFKFELCVWKPSETWAGFSGTPADALRAYLQSTDVLPDVFLCGPPMMVEAVTEVATAAGIQQEQIFCERFA